jgi:integrase/recombinase XerD
MNKALIPAQENTRRTNPTLPENATDALVINMWLRAHPSPRTRDAYRADIVDLCAFTDDKQLQTLSLLDLLDFETHLADDGKRPTSIARKLSAVKSLLTFCQKSGYTTVNVGAALKLPTIETHLAERIMSENQVLTMLALETDPRNHAMIRLLYNAGLRVSEVCALTWNDLQTNEKGGQVHVFGKGGKERYILISKETYQELIALRQNALDFAPVFVSRKTTKSGFLERGQVNRIVEDAAIRAGVAVYTEQDKDGHDLKRSRVSPHWIRHAHASHALDRKAPVMLVRDTLGHASIATTNKYSHARPGESSGTFLTI